LKLSHTGTVIDGLALSFFLLGGIPVQHVL